MTKIESRRDMSESHNTNGVMIKYLLTMLVAQNVAMSHVVNIIWAVDHVEYVSMVGFIDRYNDRLTVVNGRQCV
jgi:hypothetical protein